MPYVILSSFLNHVLVLTLSLHIYFAPNTRLHTLTAEELKFIRAYVNLTCLETISKAKDSDVSSSKHSQNIILS